MKSSKLFIILFFILFSFIGNAQKSSNIKTEETLEKISISKEQIAKYRQSDSFDYTIEVKEKNFIDRFYSWVKRQFLYYGQKFFEWIFGVKSAGTYFYYFVKTLPYLAIVVFLYFIFRYLIGIDLIRLKKTTNIKFPMVDMTDEERIMQEEDLKKLIAEAISNNDYRLAVRYHYLSLLKKLVDKELIDWRSEKTNRDYVSELQSKPFSGDFKKLTFVYDYVWCGRFVPNKDEFSEISSDFSKFSAN